VSGQAHQEKPTMPHSVMLVDDDEDLRSLMSISLKKAGYEVYLASNGEEALDLVNTVVPDIFIVDVMMPGISGYEVCEQLRASPKTAKSHIFILSARSDLESVNEGMQAGADRYLIKPMQFELIISYIKGALQEDSG
jgi:DNA-binding response OmpR family regulator